MNILLVGHTCSPHRGADPDTAWNLALELSTSHQVWLIAHPEYQADVDDYLKRHPHPNLQIVWVSLPSISDPWNPSRGERGIRLHYLLWHRVVTREVERLLVAHPFDIVHHVSWSTISSPPRYSHLRVPFVWGPVGGGQTAPPAFRKYFHNGWIKEAARSARVRSASRAPVLRQAIEHCDLLFATNHETADVLRHAGATEVELMNEAGITRSAVPDTPVQRPARASLTIGWAGDMEHRKGLPLALEALARVDDPGVRLLVAGDGPLRMHWEAYAEYLGIAPRVHFVGSMNEDQHSRMYDQIDAYAFTSLRDSSDAGVIHAMAHSLPMLTLDHHGAGTFVPSDAGIRVPVRDPEETVLALAGGMHYLRQNVHARLEMGRIAWRYAHTQA